MHCPYCGKEISESAKVCPYCGREQKKKMATIEEVVQAPPPKVAKPAVETQAAAAPKFNAAKKEQADKKSVAARAADESAAPPAAATANPNTSPNDSLGIFANNRMWLVLGAMLVSSLLNEGISNSISINFDAGLYVYFALNGALYGAVIWLALKIVNISLGTRSGFLIVLAWMISWALRPILGDIFGVTVSPDIGWLWLRVIAAALAGFATGWIIQQALVNQKENLHYINSVGWGGGWLAGSLLARAIPANVEYLEFGQPLFLFPPPNWILGVLLAVAIGGLVMLWPMREFDSKLEG